MAIHFAHIPATFVHIPKTAGSSFEQWCKDNVAHDRQSKHCTARDAQRLWFDTGTVFTFVRNPYDRLVSQFHFVGQRAQERIQRRAQGLKTKKSTDQSTDLQIAQLYEKGFENWLHILHREEPSAYDLGNILYRRGAPQSDWFDSAIDIVIRVENLKNEFTQIQQLLGCTAPLPITNTSTRSHYRDYYTAQSKQIADQLVAPDLERFDYVF